MRSWIQYDPVNRDSAYAASKAAFGDYVDAQYKLDAADVIVSLDADFLSGAAQPGFHRLAKDYAKRSASSSAGRATRHEPAVCRREHDDDHRAQGRSSPGAPGERYCRLRGGAGGGGGRGLGSIGYSWSDDAQKFLSAVAKDLKANGGKCVVIPGEQQSARVHLAAIAINDALGNVGKTVVYTETVNPLPSIQGDDLKSLVADMNAGKVDWLVILERQPGLLGARRSAV